MLGKFWVIILLYGSLMPVVFADLFISEVMPNPVGSDSDAIPYGEWVEIYNSGNESVDLKGYVLYDSDDSHELYISNSSTSSNSTVINPQSYLVIYRNGDSDFSLNNDADLVRLFDGYPVSQSTLINAVFYEAAIEGISFSYTENNSVMTYPTPGDHIGELYVEESLDVLGISFNLDATLFVGIEYTSLFYVTNNGIEKNVSLYYTVSSGSELLSENISEFIIVYTKSSGTGYVYFNETGTYTICGSLLNTSTSVCAEVVVVDVGDQSCNQSLTMNVSQLYYFNENIQIDFDVSDSQYPFLIEYWVETLYGSIVKSKYNSSNLNKKSFSLDQKGSDAYIVKASLHSFCNNSNEQLSQESYIIVKSNITSSDDSYFMFDDELEVMTVFGGRFDVRFIVYKGDTQKSSVKLYVEDENERKVSYTSSLLIDSKYTMTEFKLPVQMHDRCYSSTRFYLVLEGLDMLEKKRIDVDLTGGSCVKPSTSSSSSSKSLKQSSGSLIVSSLKGLQFTYEVPVSFTDGLNVSVTVQNYDSFNHTLYAYTYIYRGSKSYSGERELNAINVTILPDANVTFNFTNVMLDKSSMGDYKFKLRILKDNRKTFDEYTDDVVYLGSSNEQHEDSSLSLFQSRSSSLIDSSSNVQASPIVSSVVYEESLVKNTSFLLLYLFFLSIGLNGYLFLKNP